MTLLFASCIEHVAVVKNSDIIMSLNDSQNIQEEVFEDFWAVCRVGSIKFLIKAKQNVEWGVKKWFFATLSHVTKLEASP